MASLSAELIASSAIGSLQTHVNTVLNAADADTAVKGMVEALRQSLVVHEKVAASVDTAEQAISADRVKATLRKELSESSCVGGLKVLGSDKSELKHWNEMFVHAISQSLGAPWRLFMKNLNGKLSQDCKVRTDDELDNVASAGNIVDHLRAKEDLYYVLVERTEGDAALRVESGEPGGVFVLWFVYSLLYI